MDRTRWQLKCSLAVPSRASSKLVEGPILWVGPLRKISLDLHESCGDNVSVDQGDGFMDTLEKRRVRRRLSDLPQQVDALAT